MNNKNIIIAGAIAVGLYLFSHTKKIIPMTLAQKAAWHEKVSRRMAQMSTAEKIRALKAARKEKAAAEGTSEQKTRLTPMEMMLALRAQAEEKLSEKKQGTGFDYVRERAPLNKAIHIRSKKIAEKIAEKVAEKVKKKKAEEVEDKKKTAVKKATAKKIAQKIAQKVAEKVKKKKAEEAEAKKKADKEKTDKKQEDLLSALKNWGFFPF